MVTSHQHMLVLRAVQSFTQQLHQASKVGPEERERKTKRRSGQGQRAAAYICRPYTQLAGMDRTGQILLAKPSHLGTLRCWSVMLPLPSAPDQVTDLAFPVRKAALRSTTAVRASWPKKEKGGR
jgi:hypothetical protein